MIDEKQFRPYHVNIRELSIYVNDYCSKKCRHCYFIKDGGGHSDIDPEWIKWCIDNFHPDDKKKYTTIERVVIIGGEPTICKNLLEIIKTIKSKKHLYIDKKDNIEKEVFPHITISTNCDWVNWGAEIKKGKATKKLDLGPDGKTGKDVLNILKEVDSVQISIEGDKHNTDETRGKGSFDNSMTAVDLLKKEGVDVFFRATYSWMNYDQIPKMIQLAKEKDVHLILFPYKGHDAIPLEEEQQEELYNNLMNCTSEDGKEMGAVNIPQYYTYIGLHGYCPAGRNIINILPDGTITPCEMNMPPDHFILGKFEKELNKDNGGEWLDKELLLSRCKFFLENIKQVDMECVTCKHYRVCRSGCQETVEYMNCPLKYQIDYSNYIRQVGISREQTRQKITKLKIIMNKRKGC